MMAASFCPLVIKPFSSIRLIRASGPLPTSAGRYMGTSSERADFTSIDWPRQRRTKKNTARDNAKERIGHIRKRKHRALQGQTPLSGSGWHHGRQRLVNEAMTPEIIDQSVSRLGVVRTAFGRGVFDKTAQFHEAVTGTT